jgi:hypothetical protein
MFSKKTDNKANFMQQMKEEKDKLSKQKQNEKHACLLQRVCRGALARIRTRKSNHAELVMNLDALDKLSAMVQ